MSRVFNGTSDVISPGDPSLLQFTGAMTVTAWVYLSALGVPQVIVSKRGGTGVRSWSFSIQATNDLAFIVVNDINGTVNASAVSGVTFTTGVWYFMAGVYIPSTSVAVYVDTAQSGINTTGIPTVQFTANGLPIEFGRRPTVAERLTGRLEDIRLHDVALSAANLLTVRNGGNPVAPIGWWPLAGTASPEPDISGNGLNATVTGTTQGPVHPSPIAVVAQERSIMRRVHSRLFARVN